MGIHFCELTVVQMEHLSVDTSVYFLSVFSV